ncbi:DEKNAAC104086 [Brettanomyces naardenensis]|uniref:DEKNAAC104086 n=1 Tax=Brettanomyces naardenensis TaxID=13370 RepID=A0A448YPX3_BRENA|nr:DEKNAAC104086 [Brettanomyces naardenensis]
MESQYLVNLVNYKPVFYGTQSLTSVWHRLPMARRSAVLVLLFQGRHGELRVVLTKRSRKLRHFSGHISFPGGKVDNGLESEFMCARRETEEEIGISRDNNYLWEQFGCEVKQLKVFPSYLARTMLSVAPCVGFLNWEGSKMDQLEEQNLDSLILNPGESASVFSVPLRDFLQPRPRRVELRECLKQSYIKTKWAGIPWSLRQFVFPCHSENEVKWLADVEDLSSASEASEDETHEDQEFDIRTRNCWGLTANILHDIAEVIYNNSSDKVMGQEDLIWSMLQHGQMQKKERSSFEKKLINNVKGCSFEECVGEEDFKRLKKMYGGI